MSGPLAGRHALVTGSGSGIGAAIAQALSAAGARVTLAGRRRTPLETVAQACSGPTHVAADFDVTDAAQIAVGIEAARAKFGALDILVNNAGEAPSAPFEKTTIDMWNHVMRVDLGGVFLVTQAALPDLKASAAGRVINIASTAGLRGYGYVSAYCAAKHGVVGMTRALALELARTKVTVNAICPGFTETPLIDASIENIVKKTGRSAEEARKELARSNPQGKLVQASEVADAVLWLAGAGASSITGQAISVSGGEVMAG